MIRSLPLQSFLAAIVESSDDAIIGKDLSGVILTWNRAAEHLYGYSAAEAVGRNVSMLLPFDRADEVAHILDSIDKGEKVDHHHTKRVRKDGQTIEVWVTVSPVRDEGGWIVGAATIARGVLRDYC